MFLISIEVFVQTLKFRAEAYRDPTLDKLNSVNLENIKKAWSTVLSDHCAQTMTIAHGVQLLTWNIMTQGKKEKPNNAYRMAEDLEPDYKPRLRRIAKALGKQVEINPAIAIIVLQEVPNNEQVRHFFLQEVQAQLPIGWGLANSFYQQTKPNNFGLLTLFHPDALIQRPTVVGLVRLHTQKHRVLIVDFTLCGNGEVAERKIRVVNGHLTPRNEKGRYSIDEIAQDIDLLLNSIETQVVIAADFNQDMSALEKRYPDHCYYQEDTSFCYEGKTKVRSQGIDGFIFKYPPETHWLLLNEKSTNQ